MSFKKFLSGKRGGAAQVNQSSSPYYDFNQAKEERRELSRHSQEFQTPQLLNPKPAIAPNKLPFLTVEHSRRNKEFNDSPPNIWHSQAKKDLKHQQIFLDYYTVNHTP